MLIDPKSKKPTKIGFKQNKKGVITRFAKKSGELINDWNWNSKITKAL